MKLTIIIPAYNEVSSIEEVVKKIMRLKIDYSKEIIIVNDGSTDGTDKVLDKIIKSKDLKIITNVTNLGKGRSIVNALKQSTGDIVLIQDADLEYDPKDIPNLLRPFKDKKISVVYGSRILKNNPISNWMFNLGGKLLTFIANSIYGTNITDEATGYKLFRSKVLKSLDLKSKGFEFCPEVTAKISKKGINIFEVPISYNPRPTSEKKIKWWDGISAIYYLVKYRLFN